MFGKQQESRRERPLGRRARGEGEVEEREREQGIAHRGTDEPEAGNEEIAGASMSQSAEHKRRRRHDTWR